MPETDVVWYGITGGLFIVYAVLDAPETGIGIWYLFTRPARRRNILYSMSGNQFGSILWLTAALGALWFGFPGIRPFVQRNLGPVLITVFTAYIFRIAAIRHRERILNEYVWDWIYAVSGVVPPLVFGIAVGCLLKGVPLGSDGTYAGSCPELFTIYSLLAGATSVFMYATAASLNWAVRAADFERKQALRWANISWVVLLILFLILSYLSIAVSMYISYNFVLLPILLLVPLTALARIIHKKRQCINQHIVLLYC
jgi:cytochrome d ubiquinol oxidase subunit II